MAIAPLPGAPSTPSAAPPPESFAPPSVKTYGYGGSGADAPRRRRAGVVGGLILIALGIAVLGGTWFPGQGAWLFVGLGMAFLVARVLTGRHGYAVPAGILLAFGAFVWFTETDMLTGPRTGGMFFIFLGLGFLAVYIIAGRPGAVWSLLPGALLIGFGAFIQVTMLGAPFERFWWLAQFWPVSLVAVGAWLLMRDQLPPAARTPVAVGGASVLIIIGLLVAAAGMTTVTSPYGRMPLVMPMPWPMFQSPSLFGNPPLRDVVSVSAPLGPFDSIQVVNASGSTVVRATSGSEVRVQATRHYWTTDQAPDVRLVPAANSLAVEMTPTGFGPAGAAPYIDYVIDTPSALGANVRSASGSVLVTGLLGAVRLESASGALELRDLQGPAVVSTSSGGIRLTNVTGDVRVATVSGGIHGMGVTRVTDARSTSGDIDLLGDFATDAQIATASGSMTLRLMPTSSVHIDAASTSGSIDANDLVLSARQTGTHSLLGNLGAGLNKLSVRTTSGNIKFLTVQ
jgi:Putative adhesin